jgi:hypothetical protein
MRDITVVLKYEIPAIRNSDFLTGNHTCILTSRKKSNNDDNMFVSHLSLDNKYFHV